MNAIRNHSSYPTDEVREVVRFAARSVDTARTAVHVEDFDRHGFAGTAYPDIWWSGIPFKYRPLPDSSEYFVRLKIAPPHLLCLPFTTQYRKTAPSFTFHNWQETLLALAAHEFKHIEEFREGLKSSEVRCEYHAARVLEEYRLSVCYNAPIKGNQRSAA